MPISLPWYHECEKQIGQANRLIRNVSYPRKSAQRSAYAKESLNFRSQSLFRVIFESNLIEKAGLSLRDTKKAILQDAPPDDKRKIKQLLAQLNKQFQEAKAQPKRRNGNYLFARKRRPRREVVQHYLALKYAIEYIFAWHFAARAPGSEWKRLIPELSGSREKFFSEELIKKLHFIMGEGLMPEDAGIEAGFYRIDNRTTDFVTFFPAHENVPAAMLLFVRRANRLMRSRETPIVKAARISYDFVAIHPFPDFNGRMSRLIMNMVLLVEGLPFAVALKGDKRAIHKYSYSLKRANRGKIDAYACLIAQAVNEAFDQFNKNLELAGIKPLEPRQ